MDESTKFWRDSSEKYQELVESYYKNINYKYPSKVTSRRMCSCLDYSNYCSLPRDGKAEYIEYDGPRISNL